MPTVSVPKDEFLRRLGGSLTLAELEELCFSFGVEYEECLLDENGVEVIKIEIPANRYDLLCLEGLVTALLAYRWDKPAPTVRYSCQSPRETAYVEALPEPKFTRPYIFAACLRGVKLTQQSYTSLMDLQSKLHQNLCRKRTLAAIGTHDMDRIVEPLVYGLERPEDIVFAPLCDASRDYSAAELVKHYNETNNHLKPYLKILDGLELYPVLRDATGKVCSWPPITNSAYTKVTVDTRNLFIEVTATDRVKGNICLNMLIHCFSQYCADPFTVEPYFTKYSDGLVLSPDLSPRHLDADLAYLRNLIGVPGLTGEDACMYLKRMMIDCEFNPDKGTIEASVPISRPDIQHACDIGEDIAIAFGYNSIAKHSFPMGRLKTVTYMSRAVRDVLFSCGYKETLMPILDSLKTMYERMGWHEPAASSPRRPVLLKNSKISELEACRVSLIPGILRTIANLKGAALPIQVFEVGDVVWRHEGNDVSAMNNTNVACGYANSSTAGLEEVQGVSEILLNELGFYSEYQKWEFGESHTPIPETWKHLYRLEEVDDGAFMPGRAVKLVTSASPSVSLGTMGVVHPDVLRRFHIQLPVTVFELDLSLVKRIIS
ncbi:phenylalanyl-tRNA synthetase, beta subunit family protein, putative [Babesia bigemina]|uniref:phenylalanine--tRNA ligase n=1 Tax=Babesia bigemina TaxID=5866 RepID=A0A061DBT4_BABBI|nr:phenylalanyl-tRNA synthetase, beta subunit family protein, putative [Babesia bigemina]CDR97427.1 phenylalanyl-tRNA synthetase, beta subunit family protein, putative [Babesia bigemina]|eukprot:XP_012769613.1 phenylalanyl-tRNA synthetase, beta subunit family protein, putative [Babesia bigemina]